jgi:hypothetical protein
MSTAPEPDSFRIGTAEREDAMRVLGDHFAAGRLTSDEYETRVSAATPYPPYALPYQQPFTPPVGYYTTPMSNKSKVTAGVLQLVFPFGVGRFYTGHIGMGIAQLFVVLFTFGIGALWPWIDGIILLASGGTDSMGRRLQD